MKGRQEIFDETGEFDEIPDEGMEGEIPEEIPEVWWAKDIEKIEDPDIRKKEIEVAKDILERDKELDEKLESGEITEYQHWVGHDFGVRKDSVKASTRCSLESLGLSHDHLADLSEEYDNLVSEESLLHGNIELDDKKAKIPAQEKYH